MPYSNLPKSLWGKMEDCVADVKAKGNVDDPYAVCYASLKEKYKKILKEWKQEGTEFLICRPTDSVGEGDNHGRTRKRDS